MPASPVSADVTMATIVATPANDTPCTSGSWQPKKEYRLFAVQLLRRLQKRGGNQQADFARAEACRLTDDKWDGYNAAIHGQNMLKSIKPDWL